MTTADVLSTGRPADPADADAAASGPSMTTRLLDVVSFLARFIMAAVWISAGWSKVGNWMVMTQSIEAYRIFTHDWSFYLAHLIGPLELAGGLLLLLGMWLRPVSKLANVVLVLFIIGISQAWARGLELDCGCFSADAVVEDYPAYYLQVIVRDVMFIALTTWTVYRPFNKWAVYP